MRRNFEHRNVSVCKEISEYRFAQVFYYRQDALAQPLHGYVLIVGKVGYQLCGLNEFCIALPVCAGAVGFLEALVVDVNVSESPLYSGQRLGADKGYAAPMP